MIGFSMVGTNDMPRARSFYNPLMQLLGASMNEAWSTDTRVWYMTSPNAPMMVVTKPFDGQAATPGNGTMVALVASSQQDVAAVHAKAVALGGTDEGGPGYRSKDPGDLYRAYFRDFDGNKLMVFTMATSQ